MKKYIKASFDNEIPDWLRKDKGALLNLNRIGINLKSMDVASSPSGRGKDYPIYLIGTPYRPFVWIPGIYNDNEQVMNPNSKYYEAVKYVPKKYLDIRDVVYLSKTDYRKEPDLSRGYKDPRYVYDRNSKRRGQYAGQYRREGWKPNSPFGKWSTGGMRNRDKSGYEIPDPQEKLKNFYVTSGDQGAKRLAARLEQVYNKLVDLKARIFDIDFKDFGVDYNGEPDYSSTAYQNILSIFGDTCRNYRIALKNVERAQKISDTYHKEYYIEDALDYIKACERKIPDIEKAISRQRY